MIKSIYHKLDNFPKRINKKQKAAFREFLQTELSQLGYETKVTSGRYVFKCHNVETECAEPEIILGAHYDTPTILPFYFEYLFRLFGHTRQIFMIIAIFAIVGILTPFFVNHPELRWFVDALKITFYLSFITLLIPNPRNRNDNTSGVASLLEIADRIASNENLKSKVKFIFFDNEELGLLGSLMHKSKMKKLGYALNIMKFISIDCVGRGDVAVLAHHNKRNEIATELNVLFRENDEKARTLRLPFYPISDNYAFVESDGVNISFMNKTWLPGGYYIKNVHSPRDFKIEYDKIEKTCDVLEQFIQNNIEMKIDEQK